MMEARTWRTEREQEREDGVATYGEESETRLGGALRAMTRVFSRHVAMSSRTSAIGVYLPFTSRSVSLTFLACSPSS